MFRFILGAIYGLAIYNYIIIYVPFPLVLYKKLLGESVMLDDLSDLYPTLANSLKSLLDYPDEDVEDVSLKHWHNGSNYILESLNLVRLKIVLSFYNNTM